FCPYTTIFRSVNGVIKASIANIKLDEGHGESLNFAIQKNSVKPSARGKHYVWVASQTSSNIGRWVEVDDRKDSSRGMDQRLQSAGSDYVRRLPSCRGIFRRLLMRHLAAG